MNGQTNKDLEILFHNWKGKPGKTPSFVCSLGADPTNQNFISANSLCFPLIRVSLVGSRDWSGKLPFPSLLSKEEDGTRGYLLTLAYGKNC